MRSARGSLTDAAGSLTDAVLSPLRRPLSEDMEVQFEALALEYIEVDARRKAEGLPLHERCALAAPLMDVLQGGHDEMFTKLFCS